MDVIDTVDVDYFYLFHTLKLVEIFDSLIYLQ